MFKLLFIALTLFSNGSEFKIYNADGKEQYNYQATYMLSNDDWTKEDISVSFFSNLPQLEVYSIIDPIGNEIKDNKITFTAKNSGDYTIEIHLINGEVHVWKCSIRNIDKTPPKIDFIENNPKTFTDQSVILAVNATDLNETGNLNGSGIKSIELVNSKGVVLDTVNAETGNFLIKSNGTYKIRIKDKAGNTSEQDYSITNIVPQGGCLIGKTVFLKYDWIHKNNFFDKDWPMGNERNTNSLGITTLFNGLGGNSNSHNNGFSGNESAALLLDKRSDTYALRNDGGMYATQIRYTFDTDIIIKKVKIKAWAVAHGDLSHTYLPTQEQLLRIYDLNNKSYVVKAQWGQNVITVELPENYRFPTRQIEIWLNGNQYSDFEAYTFEILEFEAIDYSESYKNNNKNWYENMDSFTEYQKRIALSKNVEGCNPLIHVTPNGTDWTNKKQTVSLSVFDKDTGIESWRYALSNDNGQTYGNWISPSSLSVTEKLDYTSIYKLKVEAIDKVGNKSSYTSNSYFIDMIQPDIAFIYDKESKKLRISISDQHSGIEAWKYSLSIDGGKTFSEYSKDYFSDQFDLQLIEGLIVCKVMAEDKAGNISVAQSDLIIIKLEKPKIATMVSFSYESEIPNEIYAKINCLDCKADSNLEVELYQDDSLISKESIKANTVDYIATFVAKNANTSLKIIVKGKEYQSELELLVYRKTHAEKETSSESLEFDAIVASGIMQGFEQENYKEYLALTLSQDRQSIFAGQGLEILVETKYTNECSKLTNYTCEISQSFTEGYQQFALFPQGAIPMKDNYLVHNQYKVPLSLSDKNFVLPLFWLGKESGKVFISKSEITSEEALEGGHKWYTDIKSDLKKYPFNIIGNNIGYNRFSWQFNGFFNVTELYSDQYRIRFVDPDNVFPSGKSNVWSVYEDWFKSLDKNNIITSIEIKEK